MKQAYFYIDDVIWVFRDLTRQRPKSLFDNSFMKMLKDAHERYGVKTQLNVFYQTDFYYGNDEFSLSEMTDAYKEEWEASTPWLKLGFHAKQEFPDYPYINISYQDMKDNFTKVVEEIARFAGKDSFTYAMIPHWLPVSEEGCRALKDCGIKLLGISAGERFEYDGNPDSLPYGHAGRLLQNRKPETALYKRGTSDLAIDTSLCSYNHLGLDITLPIKYTTETFLDEKTGLYFKDFETGPCLNLIEYKDLKEEFESILDKEFIFYYLHEQYFYPEYFLYHSDYAEKIFYVGEMMQKHGFTHIFAESLV